MEKSAKWLHMTKKHHTGSDLLKPRSNNPGLHPRWKGIIFQPIGIVAHEIGHALGFWHTHSRYDRDQFITVLEENINDTFIDEFLKQSNETNNNYGLTYDYGSVMHYGARAAALGENFTMVPKDVMYTETLGSPFIAFYDLLMMNMYYNCTGTH
ncbi:astacin [Teladorsagia circumcincta]|uniref:Metalloendopeptidase n=1 Tax=Teladorsagia circumcincta TaxID=45464 RepID=A0A2G9U8L4_TELCI|nr:astacin [Teladorsagia circumcincta]